MQMSNLAKIVKKNRKGSGSLSFYQVWKNTWWVGQPKVNIKSKMFCLF